MGVPLEVLLRKHKRGLIRNDLLAVLLDNEFLLGYLLVESTDARLRRRDIGTRLVERRLAIAWVNPREHRSSLDRLVVVDRYLGDIARNFGANQDRMRLYIRVISRYQKAAGGPVVIAIKARRPPAGRSPLPLPGPDQDAADDCRPSSPWRWKSL
jgi:hypothetical protein